MSEREFQLRIQAYMDGELRAGEARDVEKQLSSRPDLARLLEQLKGVDATLARAGDQVSLPESREFYWSKIQSAIRSAERTEVARPTLSWAAQWRQWLMPAGAVAGLVLALFLAVYPGASSGPHLEATVADPGAFTYRDFARGTTLVWLSYPAESEKKFE